MINTLDLGQLINTLHFWEVQNTGFTGEFWFDCQYGRDTIRFETLEHARAYAREKLSTEKEILYRTVEREIRRYESGTIDTRVHGSPL